MDREMMQREWMNRQVMTPSMNMGQDSVTQGPILPQNMPQMGMMGNPFMFPGARYD